MRRLLALLSLLTTVASTQAANLNVTVPGKGPYKYWTDTKPIGAAPEPGDLFDKNPMPVTVPDDGFLAILDTTRGNMVIKSTKGLKGNLKLTDADFDRVAEFKVKVQHDGKPVETADVNVIDGAGAHGGLLDKNSNGEITFYGVKQGSVEIKIAYNSKGKPGEPVDLVEEIKHDRTNPNPSVIAVIDGDVATIGSEAGTGTVPMPADNSNPADAGAPNPAPSTRMPPSPVTIVGRTITMLIGIGAVAGILYAIYYLFKRDPKTVADKLTSFGVQIPRDPHDPTVDPGVPPVAPAPPAPIQKIILEDSAPTPLGVAPAPDPGSPFSNAIGAGKLVSDTGAVLQLPEGSTLVGREAQLGIPIPDPSTLSRRHAELVKQGDHLLVRDLGSTNGTYVNGRKIDADTPLNAGDQVQFGAVRFRVEA